MTAESRKKETSHDKPRPRKKTNQQVLIGPTPFPIVGVGASAGGFEAFSEMLAALPKKSGMAFVFIQHLDPTHPSVLPDILKGATRIPVEQVKDGVLVQPDHIYVIPANTTMLIKNGALRLVTRSLVRGQHLPIDRFFVSLAAERGNQAIGVILSGTASDGTEGCRAIKAGGGIVFAQDEASAKFGSMPRSAVSAGCVDFVLPPRQIARELVRIGQHPYITKMSHAQEHGLVLAPTSELQELLSMVREASGVDFGLYKQSTLQRRIKRRMLVQHFETVKEYLRYIRKNPAELDELYKDILIHVTGFFRDKEAFDSLRENVFPRLFAARHADQAPVRIWVPGCSTGEEAYSVAITVLEYLWERPRKENAVSFNTKVVQIFATDLSESALERARSGLYTQAAVASLSPERLARFFVRLDGGYQINSAIREMCIFARQNVTRDPPFSNLDLITCRNLLIYLGPELQKRVIPTLHYALKPDGYLMLGGSESLGSFTDHFILVDKKYRIYQKKRTASRLITFFSGIDYSSHRLEAAKARPTPAPELTVDKEVERVLVNRYVPPSIVVNDQMEIVQFRGRTGDYLEPASGHPTFSLSKMSREGLLIDLRSAINKAKKTNSPVRTENVQIKSNGGTKPVTLEVVPVRGQAASERFYIVVFQEPPHHRVPKGGKGKQAIVRRADSREAQALRREILQLREQLRAVIEDHETTSEEFKSANEEVLSANEELQSTNEELETAKEELQSSNEELSTLNEELQNRNNELSLANNDLVNLLANVNIPIVMVGNDLRIRRFTPPAEKLLNLIPADLGRRLREIRPNLDFDDVEKLVQRSIDTTTVQEQETQEKDTRVWYLMKVRPYRTSENRIDGAVISFQDIDALKRTLDETRAYGELIIESAREPILLLNSDLRISASNPAFSRMFRVQREETEGKLIYDLGNGQWNIPRLSALLRQVMTINSRVDDFEVQHDFPLLGPRIFLLNARRIEPKPGSSVIFLSFRDITEQKSSLEALKRHSALLELANDAVFVRNPEGFIQLWNRGAERLYGWTKDEVLGRNSAELLRTEFPISAQATQEELLRTGHWEGELVHYRKDGERRVVSSRWAIQRDGGPPAILEINTDITDRKFYEESLRQLSTHLMRVQDEERRRIARDLHDSTGQKLVALKMQLTQLGQSQEGAGKDAFQEQMKLLDEAVQEIRTLSQLLHPPLLEEAGLASATRWLAESFGERAGLQIDLKLDDELERLPESVEIALFRVIQESLNNIHRHSGADRVSIELNNGAKSLVLRISDNGKGLPPEIMSGIPGKRATFGVGILGMRERLSQLGGTLSINSTRKGTVVEAKVPAPQVK